MNQPNQNARKLSKLGAAKGGRARASVLTPEERKEIAQNAVRARWAKQGKLKSQEYKPAPRALQAGPVNDTPYSMFRGTLEFGNVSIECHVLNDGKRVFTQREIVRVFSGRSSGDLGSYLKAIPLPTEELAKKGTVTFKIPGIPTLAIGREATELIEISEMYLEAQDQGLLVPSQDKFAVVADVIIRASAKVGIIALVDEATGYQEVRAKNALRLKLQAFIAEDMQEWARMFPQEFWMELARLEGVRYTPRSRPLRWGKYIMMFVYDAIDKDVAKELRKINPNPHYGKNHHQWLKEFGRDKLIGQIQSVITIMKLCDDMEEFKKKFARVFQDAPLQTSFDDVDWGVS